MHKKLVFPLWFVLVDEPVREPIQQPEEMSLRSSSPTEYHEYIYASGRLMRETVTTTANGTSTTEVLDFVYGSYYGKITYDLMVKAVKQVYGDMPAILDEVLEWVERNWKGAR